MTFVFRLLAGLTVTALAMAGIAPGALAAPPRGQLFAQTASAGTPQVLDGRVYSVADLGDTIVVGGSFSQVRDLTTGQTLTRANLFAFDKATGKVSTTFVPNPNSVVQAVISGADGTIYVGGNFFSLGGVSKQRLARVNLSDGSVLSSFNAGQISGEVKDLRLFGGRLYVGGAFTHIANQAQLGLSTLDPVTGRFDSFVRQTIAGQQNGGVTHVLKLDIAPQSGKLLAIGNFRTVDGVDRRQVFMLDLTGSQAVLANWRTRFYESTCSTSFNTYMRDLDISPDGSFVVISTTGGHRGIPTACDTTARFELSATGDSVATSWVDYTGGDTTYAVEITDSAVYTGGHARWQNNPYAADRAGAGAVSRPGIAALDPENGLPFSWNPTRERGVGVFDFMVDSRGLWIGSDTSSIGTDNGWRPRLALLPSAGGSSFDQPRATKLPNDLYSMSATQGLVASTTSRSSIGAALDAPDLTNGALTLRGAFMLNGYVYSAWSDGSFRRQTFDGTTYGTPEDVDTQDDLVRLADWHTDLANATSMTYQRGRIYYTLSGGSTLYYRYFTPESGVVGAARNTAVSGVTGLSAVRGTFLDGDRLYFNDTSGRLAYLNWVDGPGASGTFTGTSTTVSGPSVDGRTWSGPMFLFQDTDGNAAVGAPGARATAQCNGLTCDFSSAGSENGLSYSWDFGDGTTSTDADPRHTYAANGTYTVTLTVTGTRGRTATDRVQVEVTRVNAAPEVTFTPSCAQLSCSFDSTATDSDGSIAAYSWDFGDGGTSDVADPSHTYAAAGTYAVTLTVTDNDGATRSATADVAVSAAGVQHIATTSTNGNRARPEVVVPNGVQPGDLMLLTLTVNNSSTSVTPPSGWTQVGDFRPRDNQSMVFSRTATAGDAGSTVAVPLSTISKTDLSLASYRSRTGGELQVLTSASSFDPASALTHQSPTVQNPRSDALLVTYFSRKAGSTAAWQSVAGQTIRSNNTGVGGGNVAAVVADSDVTVGVGAQGGVTGRLDVAAGNVISWSILVAPR